MVNWSGFGNLAKEVASGRVVGDVQHNLMHPIESYHNSGKVGQGIIKGAAIAGAVGLGIAGGGALLGATRGAAAAVPAAESAAAAGEASTAANAAKATTPVLSRTANAARIGYYAGKGFSQMSALQPQQFSGYRYADYSPTSLT